MKKKLISLCIITSMVICNSMTVWAADTWNGDTYIKGSGTDSSTTTNGTDSGTKTITGTFTKDSATTYEVNIIWGNLTYAYKGYVEWDGVNGVYNAEELPPGNYRQEWNYTGGITGGNQIIITNSSDRRVQAEFSYTPDSKYLDGSHMSAKYTDSYSQEGTVFQLGSKAIADSGSIDETITVSLSGYPMGIKPKVDGALVNITGGMKIGTVTVSLGPVEE